MANKQGKRDFRTRTPPEKKKKCSEQLTSSVQEEAEPATKNVFPRFMMQDLAIKHEDLEKLHPTRLPREEQEYVAANNRILIRKHYDEVVKTKMLLVAHPRHPESACKDLVYSGKGVSLQETQSEILPHTILGTLQELKREAAARGNLQICQLIPQSQCLDITSLTVGKKEDKTQLYQKRESEWVSAKQGMSLNNWQHHLTLRRQQVNTRPLHKPCGQLIMNTSEHFERVQEEGNLIDCGIPSLEYGKGQHVWCNFWLVSERIGDELSGLVMTPQCEHGYQLPLIYTDKPYGIIQETGFTDYPAFLKNWHKSLYFKQNQHKPRAMTEEHQLPKSFVDAVEVIGQGKYFTPVTLDSFPPLKESEQIASKENQDTLQNFPDVTPDFVLGPSLVFCGQKAQWMENSASCEVKTGICARITFEALVGEKTSSFLEIVNNGSVSVWYEWRRLANNASLGGHRKEHRVQNFYFNTCAGILLPGKTHLFPFHFKSSSPGIYAESWEFCTHPVLLGGAPLQVSLWGIAVYEDKTSPSREALERKMVAWEAVAIAQETVQELLNCIHIPEISQTSIASVTKEEKFQILNPKLYYKHQAVHQLHYLWRDYVSAPVPENKQQGLSSEALDPAILSIITTDPSRTEAANEKNSLFWNLPVVDLKCTSRSIHENEKEILLFQLNNNVAEISLKSHEASVDVLHQACLQQWREAVDMMAERAWLLRFLMGMPEKDVTAEIVLEETEQKHIQVCKDEKRGGRLKEEKKSPGEREKEDKKGEKTGSRNMADKEEHHSTRKGKQKEEKSSGESIVFDIADSLPTHVVHSVVQETYHDTLYNEVYGILLLLVENIVCIAESLNPSGSAMEHKDYVK